MSQMPKKSDNTDDTLKQNPMPPLPFERHVEKTASKLEAKNAMTMKEALEMTKKMKESCAEIEKVLQEFYAKTGWTPRYLADYLKNVSKFNPDQLKIIQEGHNSLMKALKLPKELQEEFEKPLKTGLAQPLPTKKERRVKTASSRRRWISMK